MGGGKVRRDRQSRRDRGLLPLHPEFLLRHHRCRTFSLLRHPASAMCRDAPRGLRRDRLAFCTQMGSLFRRHVLASERRTSLWFSQAQQYRSHAGSALPFLMRHAGQSWPDACELRALRQFKSREHADWEPRPSRSRQVTPKIDQSNRLETLSSLAVRAIASPISGPIDSVRIFSATRTASVGWIVSVTTSSFRCEAEMRATAPPESTPCVI